MGTAGGGGGGVLSRLLKLRYSPSSRQLPMHGILSLETVLLCASFWLNVRYDFASHDTSGKI